MMEGAASRSPIVSNSGTAMIAALRAKIVETFEQQTSAFFTSGRMLDDGVIDPRDTRRVLATLLALFRRAERVALRPLSFGVARP